MIVDCFARRILAPFQGVLQVVRVGDGEAESTDGLNWVLYAAHPDILAHSGLSEVRFGTWSRAGGLRRAMVRGTAAGGLVERIGQPLIGALEAFADQVPFPLRDHQECWLLDGDSGEPLVLLDSRLPGESMPVQSAPSWLPGQAAREGFADLAGLEAALARRAGRRAQAAWFLRQADGSALGPDRRRLPASLFPRLLLTTRWSEPCERRLAEGMIDWWAPALLQLQHLDAGERTRLERAAARRALVLERLFRLYPQVLDPVTLRAARVQARMQSSPGSSGAHYTEPFHWSE
jgi:hypothetical protein